MKQIVKFTLLLAAVVCSIGAQGQALQKPLQTESDDRYKQISRSPDGIGKSYMGREIASVMGWQAAPWLERSEREKEERTDLLISSLKLKPGMVVADIGAGSGYLSRRMAKSIAPNGKVVAVDVQPEMITILKVKAREAGITNIDALLGTEQDVRLTPESIDMAIMVDVYHELAFPHEVLASLVRALKPRGQLVFVEYKAEDLNVPIKTLHKMSEEQIKLEAARHPLIWEKTVSTLPWQHVVVFRVGK